MAYSQRQKSTSRSSKRPGKRFSKQRRSGSFGSHRPKFIKKSGSQKGRFGQRLDISAFINKTRTSRHKNTAEDIKHTFQDFELDSRLLSLITAQGYITPTPIQDKVIPVVMEEKDVVGLANTGTGKTAAFLIPLIQKALLNPKEQVLIMTPTRELAPQIGKELEKITKQMGVYFTTCVGGEYIGMQIKKLKKQNHFIIGTPGRLIDLVKRRALALNTITTVVLDEADRMLDMGFINDIRFLMSQTPKERQTLCFSATMSPKIKTLVQDFLQQPRIISVTNTQTPDNIEQDVIRVGRHDKIDVLFNLLKQEEFDKVLIFGRTKKGVEELSRMLSRKGIKTESIHSDKTHAQRKRALLDFKNNKVQTLIATDVAARGLHIEDVSHVINYEVPQTYDDYIHRIGRTGRGDKQGKALTFIN
jgi:superfamily II DNA/RNA helicase